MTGSAATWLARLGGSLSSTPALAGIVVVGLVAGSLGAVSAGALRGGAEGPTEVLPLFACPDGQSQVGEVQPGEQVLVTARSADGAWLAVHFPDGVLDRAWAERAAFTLETDPGGLPVAGCEPDAAPSFPVAGSTFTITADYSPSPAPTRRSTLEPSASPSPSAAPTATAAPSVPPTATAAPSAAPTATPTATAAPTPTAAPTADTTGPVLSNLAHSPDPIYVFGDSCTPVGTVISVNASDPATVFSAIVWYSPPNGGWFQKSMSLSSGTASSGTWSVTVNTSMGWLAGEMEYYVIARDYLSNSTQIPASSFPSVTVSYCPSA